MSLEITDYELSQLDELLYLEQIDQLYDGLKDITETTSPNYKLLHESISNQKWGNDEKGEPKLIDGFVGAVLEGSSRSTKTWSGIDIIIWLSTIRHKEEGCTINIYRQTYNEFKTTIYEDFRRRLDHFGLDNPFHRAKELSSFRIGKSTVNLLGDGKFGGGCDYAFFNEVMFITQDVFKQVTMRCRKFWWMDFNPCFTVHWVFESVIPRLDVAYIRTTFKDNPFIAPNELNTIRGYEPWESGSYEIRDEEIFYKGLPVGEKNQPPPNIKNVEQGTASVFDWLVYGLGLRGSMEGVIIEHINWITEFPDLDYIYGNDFGFTVDPNSLVKYAETETDIFFELLCYEPIDTDTELANYFENVGLEKNKLIVCDSSDKYTGENKGTVEMVKGLRKAGYMARKVKKSKSIMYWLGSMKKKRLNCVKSHLWRHVKTEQENYKFKKVMGITINQPIDKYNHVFDAVRYCHIAHNIPQMEMNTEKTPRQMGINY